KVIIVDKNNNHIETTNRDRLPSLDNIKKAELLNYELFGNAMPLTNPVDAFSDIDDAFRKSEFNR
ncbi:MAG: hypothetical protein GX811_07965, partial [Lentisphaerae bacterium]|nr:hypothetical protein [Lentisphaerota bacterium]